MSSQIPNVTNDSQNSHKNNFTSSSRDKKDKTQSQQKQHHSNSAVRLADYVRQREFSKQKQIFGQVKSSQLVGDQDLNTKETKYKRENVNRIYDKISAEISKRRTDLGSKSFQELIKEENFMDEVLKMIVGTKPGDLYGKYSISTQTSIASTIPHNISNKYIKDPFFDKISTFKIQSQKPSLKYLNSRNILQSQNLKQDSRSKYTKVINDRLNEKQQSVQKDSIRKVGSVSQLNGLGSRIQTNNVGLTKPPMGPKRN